MFNCKICGKDFNYMNQTLAENEKRKRLKRHEVLCIARLEKETEIFKCKKCGLIFDDDSHPDSEKRKRLMTMDYHILPSLSPVIISEYFVKIKGGEIDRTSFYISWN